MPRKINKRLAGPQWKRVVGLTGGFGSGKSTALQIFRRRRAFTLDADAIVKKLFENNALRSKIFKRFHVSDKAGLARAVFTNGAKRRKLEAMLHPLVEKTMRTELKKRRGALAVCDVPLLYEAGWMNRFDRVIVVTAPLSARRTRLAKRGFSKDEIERRLNAQWPIERKEKKADIVLRNTGAKARLAKQIKDLSL
jgi:dephospho-CoA kinase